MFPHKKLLYLKALNDLAPDNLSSMFTERSNIIQAMSLKTLQLN